MNNAFTGQVAQQKEIPDLVGQINNAISEKLSQDVSRLEENLASILRLDPTGPTELKKDAPSPGRNTPLGNELADILMRLNRMSNKLNNLISRIEA